MDGRNGPDEHDPQHKGRQELLHQQGYNHLITCNCGKFADSGHLENLGTHTLKCGKEEQGKANHESRHESLLPGQRFRGFDPESPHGERRGALDAHQGEHVGKDVKGGPAFPAQGHINDLGHLEILGFQGGQLGRKSAPATEVGRVDDIKAQDDDTADQENKLNNPHPGRGFQTAGADVKPYDKAHEQGAHGDRYAADNIEQRGGGHQLQGRIENSIQNCGQNDQPANRFAVVIIGIHVTGRDEPVALAHQPGAL